MNLSAKFFLLLACAIPAISYAGARVDTPVVSVGAGIDGDEWYGPGYYYGSWYDDEDAYWDWRYRHRYYPANGRYYSPNRRIYYSRRHNGYYYR